MFNEAQRRVFGPYFNGEDQVYADPLTVHRRLFSLLGDPNAVLLDANSDDPSLRHQAREKLLPAAREALELVPFDKKTGRGSLEQDVMAALRSYLEWMEGKGGPGSSLPTCSPPTAPASSPADLITRLGLPSGLISDESSGSVPGQ